ncbi:Cysteine protease atg4b [Clydaea vesicula]|uniref:Cysteine protease n=1 Tax=Clydaea vesicula TaxID=447962 RepID=A0AAD5TYZ7_9FUNG|nr:Cysteine protease atg4b [Clydaea vesicula]
MNRIAQAIMESLYNFTRDQIKNDNSATTVENLNQNSDDSIVLLAKKFEMKNQTEDLTETVKSNFIKNFKSLPWLTYRSNFPKIVGTEFTTDLGWGCMLRTGQMLLCNCFFFKYFGKFCDQYESKDVEVDNIFLEKKNFKFETYTKILSWFLDSNTSHYSIHRISLLGNQHEKRVGEWFGPSTISLVLKSLVESHKESGLSLHISTDGVIYKDELPKEDTSQGVLNKIYFDSVKACFEIPHCVGVAGGRPNSSLFFLGYKGEELIFLDPHFVRPSINIKELSNYKLEDFETYHCEKPKFTSLKTLDPSLVLGFFVKDLSDLHQFFDFVEKKNSQLSYPILTIEKCKPKYLDNVDFADFDDDF